MDAAMQSVSIHRSLAMLLGSTTSLLPNTSLVLWFFSLVFGVDVWFMLSSCLELRGGPRLRSGTSLFPQKWVEMGGANTFGDDVLQAGRESGVVNIHE